MCGLNANQLIQIHCTGIAGAILGREVPRVIEVQAVVLLVTAHPRGGAAFSPGPHRQGGGVRAQGHGPAKIVIGPGIGCLDVGRKDKKGDGHLTCNNFRRSPF